MRRPAAACASVGSRSSARKSAAPASSPVRAWRWLVAASLVVLALVAAVVTIWWAASRETRTTSYRVLGDLAGIELEQVARGGGDAIASRCLHLDLAVGDDEASPLVDLVLLQLLPGRQDQQDGAGVLGGREDLRLVGLCVGSLEVPGSHRRSGGY